MVYKILDNHNIRFSQIKCDQPSFPRCYFLWNYKNTSDCVLLMITTVKCSQLEFSVSGSSHPLKSMNIQTRPTQSQIRVCSNTQASNKTKRDSTESCRKSGFLGLSLFIHSQMKISRKVKVGSCQKSYKAPRQECGYHLLNSYDRCAKSLKHVQIYFANHNFFRESSL